MYALQKKSCQKIALVDWIMDNDRSGFGVDRKGGFGRSRENEHDPMVCKHCGTRQEDKDWEQCTDCEKPRKKSSTCTPEFFFPTYTLMVGKKFEELLDAAERGDPWAQVQIAESYRKGISCKKDRTKFRRWRDAALAHCKEPAAGDNADALVCHGLCLLLETSNEDNDSRAVEFFEVAARKNHAGGMYFLGEAYRRGLGKKPKDSRKAFSWYKKAADLYDCQSQYILGFCYEYERVVRKDNLAAARWYRKAAEQNHMHAQSSVGLCYYYGNGVIEDKAVAAGFFEKAAKQGDPIAQCCLGMCYALGDGREQSVTQAVRWFQEAAEQGESIARSCLEICRGNGKR